MAIRDFTPEVNILTGQIATMQGLTVNANELFVGSQNQQRDADALGTRVAAAIRAAGVNADATALLTQPAPVTPVDPNAEPPMTVSAFTNGTLDTTKYQALANAAGTDTQIEYLYGPSGTYYGADKLPMPTLLKREDKSLDVVAEFNNPGVYGARPGRPGQNGTYQLGAPKPAEAGNYSSNYGQATFIPNNRAAPLDQGGIGVAGLMAWSCGYDTASTRPELAWWAQLYDGGGLDDIYQKKYKARGERIEFPTCASRGDGRFGNGSGVIVCYRDGRVTHSGQNTAHNLASLQLPAGLVPIYCNVTNSHEFAFILVMNKNLNKTQIAVVALAGGPDDARVDNQGSWIPYRGEWQNLNPGVGSYGNIFWMKFMGLVDLPADMKCATAISSSTWTWDGAYARMSESVDGERGSDLRQASRRAEFRDGGRRANTFPTSCTVVVVSKEERKMVALDFSKLFQFIRASTINEPGLQNVGLGAGQYPPTFAENASNLPTVIMTETFASRPTAVRCSQVDINRRIYVATQEGTLHAYKAGADRTPNDLSIQKIFTVPIGKNTTDIATTARHAGSKLLPYNQQHLEIICTSRGERKIMWVRMNNELTAGSVIRTACDSRLIDPIQTRDGPNHTTEHYLATVCDYAGQQVMNFRYGPVIFHWYSGSMGDGGGQPLLFDWKTSLPPDGTPVTPTTFNGVTYPFEHAGQFTLPGKPFGYYPSDVY